MPELYIVGAVLAYTGLIKALDTRQAAKLVVSHFAVPCHRTRLVTALVIGVECALGAALLLGVVPRVTIPAAALLLVGATALSLRGAREGRTESCGCYGSAFVPTWVSIGLNAGYLLLLGSAWRRLPATASTPLWAVGIAATIGLASGLTGWIRDRRPIVDTAPLRVGKRWRRRWAPEAPVALEHGDYLIAFVRPRCAHCATWVPFLNIEHARDGSSRVIGIIPGTAADVAQFVAEHHVAFPVLHMKPHVFDLVTDVTPTAVGVRDGRIVAMWRGDLPDSLIEQARTYYTELFDASTPTVMREAGAAT
ncbi:hypothetical protein J421_5527 (plasmid) [Gemmatirosa kalamazoonensis]|uniref:Methylamine utilisation protein MauE domain-containing protein n=1 Tax=Gemmatirosa kalamazoonensis TaxID=861299 RepID=W0RRH1_9BACT|nr:MauE/DoxX family redox-associated membrane protein [Gemmatirosa kalamazoonensis]AHG93062.1 hypothetical protein J421_5527 [Gemmatirosa kalamazoonensis]